MAGLGYRAKLYTHYASSLGSAGGSDDILPRAPYLHAVIRRHFPEDRSARILELGCGAGALLASLKSAGYAMASGVDTSREQISLARQRGVQEVVQADIFEALASLASSSVDVVAAFDVIEHLTKDEAMCLAEGVRRVLTPGGRWIVHTVNGESPFFGRVRYGDFTHESVFTQQSIRQMLRIAGFSQVESYEDAPVVHGIVSLGRAALWHVVRTGLRVIIAAETGDQGQHAILSQNFLTVATR